MKLLLKLISFFLFIEIHLSTASTQIGDVVFHWDEANYQQPTEIFQDAYTIDALALGNMPINKVDRIIPYLERACKIHKDNSIGSIFNYFLELSKDYLKLQRLSGITKNLYNFVIETGGDRENIRISTSYDQLTPITNDKTFITTKIISDNANEVKEQFEKFEHEKRQVRETGIGTINESRRSNMMVFNHNGQTDTPMEHIGPTLAAIIRSGSFSDNGDEMTANLDNFLTNLSSTTPKKIVSVPITKPEKAATGAVNSEVSSNSRRRHRGKGRNKGQSSD